MHTFSVQRALGTAHELSGPPSESISCVRFSPQGCPYVLLGVTSWDRTCRVWQVGNRTDGAGLRSQPMSFMECDAPILDMSFSVDGRVFLGGCNKLATMWDMRSNQKVVVGAHDLPISCVSHVSAGTGGEMLITGSWDGRLRFWDLRQQRPVKEENLGEPVFALDAQKSFPLALCATGRKVHVFNLQSLSKCAEVKPSSVMKFNLRAIACVPERDGVAVASSEGRVSFLSFNQEHNCTFKAHAVVDQSVTHMYQANFCVVHPTMSVIITGGGDGRICFLDYRKRTNLGSTEAKPKTETMNNSISAGDISADGTLLAYARSYDWAMGISGSIPSEPHTVQIRSVDAGAFSAK